MSVCVPAHAGKRGAGRASVQRTSPFGSSATSSLARVAGDEEPVRREGRVAVAPQAPAGAVGADEPRAAAAGHEQLARGRQREQLRLRRLHADRLAERVHDGASGRAQRRRDDRRDERPRDERPRVPARPRHGLPRLVGGTDDLPAALACLVLVRSPVAHCSRSFRLSSPRRRRELTVPRGSSSSSAISPGV